LALESQGIALKIGSDPLLVVVQIQMVFSLVAAVFLFWFGLFRLGFIQEPSWMSSALPDMAPGYQKVLQWAFVQQRISGIFLIGLMMGMLPCGLSFAAFAKALAARGSLEGGLLLLAFALGTLPGPSSDRNRGIRAVSKIPETFRNLIRYLNDRYGIFSCGGCSFYCFWIKILIDF
jgi:hypothetical protein